MKDTRSNQGDGRITPVELLESPDELIEAAREYFASDFSNPRETSCPAAKRLQAAAQSGSLPSDELRSHLFACSECFKSYRAALVLQRNKASAQISFSARWSNLRVSRRMAFAFATAIVLVALSVLSAVVFRQRAASPNEISHEKGTPGTSSDETASEPDQTQPARLTAEPRVSRSEEPRANKKSTRLASNYREIDLAGYSNYRGADDEEATTKKPIQLSASLNRLLFQLPEASAPGRYSVAIMNSAMSRTILSQVASSPEGKTLKATLDLRNLERTRYVLCISGKGRAPYCYEVVIQ